MKKETQKVEDFKILVFSLLIEKLHLKKSIYKSLPQCVVVKEVNHADHGLRTSGEEITFTTRPKINSQSKVISHVL